MNSNSIGLLLESLYQHLIQQLDQLPEDQQEAEKAEVLNLLWQGGLLDFRPAPDRPNDQFLRRVILENDRLKNLFLLPYLKNALSGESPSESVANLIFE